jgi:hypothetical protein
MYIPTLKMSLKRPLESSNKHNQNNLEIIQFTNEERTRINQLIGQSFHPMYTETRKCNGGGIKHL